MLTIRLVHKRGCMCAKLVCLGVVLALGCLIPLQAQALETERFSAKGNADGDATTVMGATPTRVTWQGQSDDSESLTGVVISLPEGTSVQADNVKVTVLQGLDRLKSSAVTTVKGTDVQVRLENPAPAGALVMLEMNRVLFPAAGGSFALKGSYTTADGKMHDLPQTDQSIQVVGKSSAEQLSSWLQNQGWVQAWNENKFLHLFFDPSLIVTSVPALFAGWLVSLGVVIVSFPLAIPFGLLFSLLRMAKLRIARIIGATYINIVRGTPLFLQLYIAFFGLPLMGVHMDPFAMGAIVLILNSSAYLAEIFRAGIQSINKGQFEAARSLGMNGAQTMVFVIIPQTVRRVIPTMTSEFILMYKDTSLLAVVGVTELMMYAKTITASSGNVTPYIVAAGFYLVVTIPLTKLINTLEVRMDGGSRKRTKRVAGGGAPSAVGGDGGNIVAREVRMSETLVGSNHLSH